jgi:hypothetical protein
MWLLLLLIHLVGLVGFNLLLRKSVVAGGSVYSGHRHADGYRHTMLGIVGGETAACD